MHPVVLNEAYLNAINNAREELEETMSKDKSWAPLMLRLAYASQFTIIAKAHDHDASKVKSSDQAADDPPSSQPKPENKQLPVAYNHDHLRKAIDICDKIKTKHQPITSPDLYQLAGVVAVKNLGGPTIGFIPGRKDSSILPDEGCVPYDKKGPSELRDLFTPIGFDDKDIVALCGGLKLARAHYVKGPPQGQTTEEPLKFDNSYFKELLAKESSNEIDQALVNDPEFRNHVTKYKEDQEAFFVDYKKSHKKLSEFKPLSWIEEALHIPMAQRAVGVAVAVAAAVAILSFFYLFRRRRASKHASQQPQ